MLVGLFDILIIGAVLFLNYKAWKMKPLRISEWFIFSFICLISFAFILPFLSMEVEIAIFNTFYRNETTDGFEGLYVLLRWPTYWSLGFFELLYLLFITFFVSSSSKNSTLSLQVLEKSESKN